jgi:glycerophosphoryl diester phosphodiesterase
MRANADAAAAAARDFGHGLLLPRGTAAAAPALIYQSRSSRVAIQRRQDVHVLVREPRHNGRVIAEDRDLRDGWLKGTPIAHRGLHAASDGRPENSLGAFERACALGFPAELDVRLTRDREVVVFHDRALRRLTGAAGRVEDRAGADVCGLRLLGTDERVPRLGDVLDLVDGRVPLLVELKSSAPGAALEQAVLRALDGYRGDVAIQSFKRRTVRELDRRDAPHAIGHLWRRRTVPAATGRLEFVGCHVDGMPRRAVRRRRESGAVVLAWTVRSAEQAQHALRFVDNYIFEGFVPDRAHALSAPGSAAGASR